MIRNVFFALFAMFISFTVIAATITNTTTGTRRKLDRQKVRERWYKRTGGQLEVPNAKQGKIVIVNAQNEIEEKVIYEIADKFSKSLYIDILVQKGAFSFPSPAIIGNATLFVINDTKLPTILHAPEERWTLVNLQKLREGNGKKPQFFISRVKKEITRGFCLLAGSQTSNYPNSLLTTITTPIQLDKFVDCELPIDIQERFIPYLAGFGIKPAAYSTYKKACQEGWAPAPTNEYQKAIWEQVKADKERGPSNPLKIPLPKKK